MSISAFSLVIAFRAKVNYRLRPTAILLFAS